MNVPTCKKKPRSQVFKFRVEFYTESVYDCVAIFTDQKILYTSVKLSSLCQNKTPRTYYGYFLE